MGWFDRRWHAGVAVAALALSSGVLVTSATADPPSEEEIAAAREAEQQTASGIATLEIELATLSTQLEDATIRAQQANEVYLGAQVELDDATARADEARAAAETAQAEVEEQRTQIGRIAMSAYRAGPGALGPIEPLLSADSFENAMRRATVTDRMGTRADESLQRFQATELVAAAFQRRADDAAAEQEEATTALATAADEARQAAASAETQLALSTDRRASLITQLAEQRGTTEELERERQESIEEERRRREEEVARAAALEAAREQEAASRASERAAREAAAQAEAADERAARQAAQEEAAREEAAQSEPESERPAPDTARPAPEPSRPAPRPSTPAPAPEPPAPKPEPAPQPPPSSSNAARQALDWAHTQLGKPYVWGATGPNGYDCSGLTQTAFARAGVSLPRTTRAQYAATSRVPVADLQAGDLIFYSNNGAASGIYHVAIYAGNGMRLHAPSPGKSVELVPMYWPNVLPYGGRV